MKSANDWTATVEDLTERARRLEEKAAGLEAERDGHTLKSALGDKQAKAELERLDGEQQQVERDLQDVRSALEQARGKVAEQHAEQQRQAGRERAGTIRKATTRHRQAAADVDDKMQALNAALEELEASGRDLASLAPEVSAGTRNDLVTHRKTPWAALHAGLGERLRLDRSFRHHAKPLAQLTDPAVSAYEKVADDLEGAPAEAAE